MLKKLNKRTQVGGGEGGFTLIELLVVVIIIGILAAIAIPVYLNQRQKAYDSTAQSDLRNMATSMEAFYTDNNATYVGADINALEANEDFKASPGATDAVDGVTATTYCLSSSVSGGSGTWYLTNSTNAPVKPGDPKPAGCN